MMVYHDPTHHASDHDDDHHHTVMVGSEGGRESGEERTRTVGHDDEGRGAQVSSASAPAPYLSTALRVAKP
eukprot:3432851-Rhodomonas_salina.2